MKDGETVFALASWAIRRDGVEFFIAKTQFWNGKHEWSKSYRSLTLATSKGNGPSGIDASKTSPAASRRRWREMSAEKIRTLNDLYRTKGVGIGRTMMTAGIVELGAEFQLAARLKVRTFNEFDSGNDPHREHDFGSFELEGQKVFFKFEYFDRQVMYGSEDPADPFKTCRVLTIMLAEDY